MQKDYTVRLTSETTADSTEISAFWTAKWQDQNMMTPEINKVPASEEFLATRKYLSKLPAKAKILDGGCGLGHWTLYFDRLGHDVIGLDISKPTIDRLTCLFPDARFEHGDIRTLPFEADSFDLYFSWGTFEHFEEGMHSVLKEAHRVLRPGGRILSSVPLDNWRHRARRASKPRLPAKPTDEPHVFYQWRFTHHEIVREFTQRGFVVDAIIPLHKEQGASRMLVLDFGVNSGSRLHVYGAKILAKLLPARLIAHMQMVVAHKTEAAL